MLNCCEQTLNRGLSSCLNPPFSLFPSHHLLPSKVRRALSQDAQESGGGGASTPPNWHLAQLSVKWHEHGATESTTRFYAHAHHGYARPDFFILKYYILKHVKYKKPNNWIESWVKRSILFFINSITTFFGRCSIICLFDFISEAGGMRCWMTARWRRRAEENSLGRFAENLGRPTEIRLSI